MAVDVDYYALLGLPRDASTAAIQEAVKQAVRQWRKKTEASDLDARHAAWIRAIRGRPPASRPIDAPLTRQAVLAAVDRTKFVRS